MMVLFEKKLINIYNDFPLIIKSFIIILIILIYLGCAIKPVPIVLDYNPSTYSSLSIKNLGDKQIIIKPFDDLRTDKFLYAHFVMREQDDAGIYVANAIKIELEKIGAKVDTIEKEDRPTQGFIISGRVNQLKARASGWMLGGIIAALIGTGFSANIDITIEYVKDGISINIKQYHISKKVRSNAAKVILVGPDVSTDVPKSFQITLQELIQKQILSDISLLVEKWY